MNERLEYISHIDEKNIFDFFINNEDKKENSDITPSFGYASCDELCADSPLAFDPIWRRILENGGVVKTCSYSYTNKNEDDVSVTYFFDDFGCMYTNNAGKKQCIDRLWGHFMLEQTSNKSDYSRAFNAEIEKKIQSVKFAILGKNPFKDSKKLNKFIKEKKKLNAMKIKYTKENEIFHDNDDSEMGS